MITIRELRPEDIEVILPFVEEMYLQHDKMNPSLFVPNSISNAEIYTNYSNTLSDDQSQVFVAELDGEIIGTIRCDIKKTPDFYKERFVGYTDDLIVLPNFQRRGVAKLLKSESERWFKSKNINLLECKIYEWNEASSNLSESMGYKKTFSHYYKTLD